MRTFPYLTILLLAGILLILDAYAYKGWKKLAWPLPKKVLLFLSATYWIFNIGFVLYMLWISFRFRAHYDPDLHVRASYLFGIGLATGIPKIIFIFFHGIEDMIRLLNKAARRIFGSEPVGTPGQPMDRATFITKAGLGLAAIPFIGISYGILRGRFDFRVVTQKLAVPNLPDGFDGMRIVQLSDIHIGSFDRNFDAVKVGVEMANRQEGDVLLFTGDLVNNYAEEMEGWLPLLGHLEAKQGMFSVLGNHDYGDYSDWESQAAKVSNQKAIREMNRSLGFDLLMNEHRILEKNGQHIAMIGVENWGRPPFHQYGDLSAALQGVDETIPFKILLSHDPSHWDAQVLGKTDIDLTFSGHTHGAQFGVEVGKLKWSPVQMRYPRWAGLYTEGKQHLYVNRGFGYIGFPGRVGMPPEITVLELHKTVDV